MRLFIQPGQKLTSFLFVVCFFISFSAPRAGAAGVTLLTPASDCTIYARQPATHMVLQVDGNEKLNSLQVMKGGEKIPYLAVRRKKQHAFVHYLLPLQPGENTFILFPDKKKITIQYKPIRTLLDENFDSPGVFLYHRKETMQKVCRQCHDVTSPPKEFSFSPSPYGNFSPACYTCHKGIFAEMEWKHGLVANLQCETCHIQDKEIGRIGVAVGQDSSLCYRCHKVKGQAWGEKHHLHQPIGFGRCSICHNPHGEKHQYMLWADGKAELCVGCHVNKEALLADETEGLMVHGIIKGGGCIACHDPHADENPYMLYAPVNELCASCHNDFIDLRTGHPVGMHPVKGPSNPLKPDEEFNCASCHDPHGSKGPYLLINDVQGDHICLTCHN